MKKTISIILAVLLVCTLFACGKKDDTAKVPSNDDAAVTPSKDEATEDKNDETTENNNETDDTASPDTSSVMTDDEKKAKLKEMFGDIEIYPEMLSLLGGNIGYITDDVDYSSRDKLKFAFIGTTSSAATKNLINAMNDYGKYFNYEIEEAYSDNDVDKYMTLLETYALNGFNGFILNPDNNVFPRTVEVLEDLNVPYVWALTAYKDADGHNQVPIVGEDNSNDGVIVFDWILNNYIDSIGDIDLDKVGVIGLYWSVNIPMTQRVEAAETLWTEKYPDRANQFFYVDTAAQAAPVSQEAAYNEISTFISSHNEYEYWFVSSAAGLFANGAARAIEGLGLDDNALICSVGIEELINQWNAGYDGCWGGCAAIDPRLYSLPMVTGLIALCDGRATPETLWSELRPEGDLATYYIMEPTVITRENYEQYAAACQTIYEYFAK